LEDNFRPFEDNIFGPDKNANSKDQEINQLITLMSEIADLDFTKTATTLHLEENSELKALESGLLLLQNRLEQKILDYQRYKDLLNCFDDSYIVTNKAGEILDTNNIFKKKHLDVLEDKTHIADFFNSLEIQFKYQLQFAENALDYLDKKIIVSGTPESPFIMHIDISPIISKNGDNFDYCYKISYSGQPILSKKS